MSTVTAAPAATKFAERINRIEPSATMAVVAEADKLRQSGVDVVDLSVGEPHFSTPQHIKEAAIAAINNNFTRYTAVGGTVELKDAIIQRHTKDFGSGYKRDEVMASVGWKHVLFNAIQVLVDHGDEVILSVPNYDFNWQTDYVFRQPLKLPKGTVLHSSAWYDNSAANKTNPNSNVDVHWGDQTWEEMQFTAFTFTLQPQQRPSTGAQQ